MTVSRSEANPAGRHRGEVAREDDELGVGGERGEGVAPELEVEVGENLDSHEGGGFYRGPRFVVPSSAFCSRCAILSRVVAPGG